VLVYKLCVRHSLTSRFAVWQHHCRWCRHIPHSTWFFTHSVDCALLISLQAVYKGVRAWSRRALERAGERVMDVQNDDDNDDE
jgi:hypothetical protein